MGALAAVEWCICVRKDNFGVAARTLLYPALETADPSRACHWGLAPDPAERGATRVYILDGAGPPGLAHDIAQSIARGARCVLVPWSSSPRQVREVVEGLAPEGLRVADIWSWSPVSSLAAYLDPVELLPAIGLRDTAVITALDLSAERCGPVTTPPSAVFVLGAGKDLVQAIEQLGVEAFGEDTVIVTPRRDEIARMSGALGLGSMVVDEAGEGVLDLLAQRPPVVVLASRPDRSLGLVATWAMTGAFAGCPTIAGDHPSLDFFGASIIRRDLRRAMNLYGSSDYFRTVDPSIAQAHAFRKVGVECAAPAWRALLSGRRAGESIHAAPIRRPVALVLIDLAQDVNLVLSLLKSIRWRDEMDLRIVVTDWLEREAPRTFALLKAHGFAYEIVSRKRAIAGSEPSLEGVGAFISATTTDQAAHRVGHGLSLKADRLGIPTFTVQHGLENLGLTYRDAVHSSKVTMASRFIFAWQRPGAAPPWLSTQTWEKLIGSGPTTAPRLPATPLPMPRRLSERSWRKKVFVFENLHWHRYSTIERQQLLEDFKAAAAAMPDCLFAVKPHGAGRWVSSHRTQIDMLDNVLIIDPLDPRWRVYAAPDLIEHADVVITTPSTVTLDGARAGRNVGVLAQRPEQAEFYAPLPAICSPADWRSLIDEPVGPAVFERNEVFIRRQILPFSGEWSMAGVIAETALMAGVDAPVLAPNAG
jgi:hypothetical protein